MRISGLDAPGIMVTALIVAAVIFVVKDGPLQDSSLVLIALALAGVFVAAIDGPWKNEDGRIEGWVGVLLVAGLVVWVFMLLRDTSNPCIEFDRTDEGGECVRYADER